MTQAIELQMKCDIQEQIDLRERLLKEMVGTLYPSIVKWELGLLYDIRDECKPPN